MAEGTTEGATPTETTETTTTETTEVTETPDDLDAMRDALKKANAEAKKFRLAAKANETELEKARQASMSEQEKAVAQAKTEGRTEALREAGAGRVEDAVRAAAGGRNVDVDALLDGLDRSKFLGDEGNPDREAITAFMDRLAPAPTQRGDGFTVPDLAQGTRGETQQGLGSTELEKALVAKLGIPRS